MSSSSSRRDRLRAQVGKKTLKPFCMQTTTNQILYSATLLDCLKKMIQGGCYPGALSLISQAEECLPGCVDEKELREKLQKHKERCESEIKSEPPSRASAHPPAKRIPAEKASLFETLQLDRKQDLASGVRKCDLMLLESPAELLSIPDFKELVEGMRRKYEQELRKPGRCLAIDLDNQNQQIFIYYHYRFLEDETFFSQYKNKTIPLPVDYPISHGKLVELKFQAVANICRLFCTKESLPSLQKIVYDSANMLLNYIHGRETAYVGQIQFVYEVLVSMIHALILQGQESFIPLLGLITPSFISCVGSKDLLLRWRYAQVVFHYFTVNGDLRKGIKVRQDFKEEVLNNINDLKRENKIDDAHLKLLEILEKRVTMPVPELKEQRFFPNGSGDIEFLPMALGRYPIRESLKKDENENELRATIDILQLQIEAAIMRPMKEIFDVLGSPENIDNAIFMARAHGTSPGGNFIFTELLLDLLHLKIIRNKKDMAAYESFKGQFIQPPPHPKKATAKRTEKKASAETPSESARRIGAARAAHEHTVELARAAEAKKKATAAVPAEAAVLATAVLSAPKHQKKKKKPPTRRSPAKKGSDVAKIRSEAKEERKEIKEDRPVMVSANFVQKIFHRHRHKPVVDRLAHPDFKDFFSMLSPRSRVFLLSALRRLPLIEEDGKSFFPIRFKGSINGRHFIARPEFKLADIDARMESTDLTRQWAIDNGFSWYNHSHRLGYVNFVLDLEDNDDKKLQCFLSLETRKTKTKISGENHIPFSSLESLMDKDEKIHIKGLTPEIKSDFDNKIFRVILPDLSKKLAGTARSYLMRVIKYYHYYVIQENFTPDEKSTQQVFNPEWIQNFLTTAHMQNIGNFYNEISRLLQWQMTQFKTASASEYGKHAVMSVHLLRPFLNSFFSILLTNVNKDKIDVPPEPLTNEVLKLLGSVRDTGFKVTTIKEEYFERTTSQEWLSLLCDDLAVMTPDLRDSFGVVKQIINASSEGSHFQVRFFPEPRRAPVPTATSTATITATAAAEPAYRT